MDKKSYLSNLRVLLVEDDLDTLRQMEIMLRRRCGKVYTANNGKLGLKAYESVDPDVIITDLKMPLMGGIEMSRKIREKDRGPSGCLKRGIGSGAEDSGWNSDRIRTDCGQRGKTEKRGGYQTDFCYASERGDRKGTAGRKSIYSGNHCEGHAGISSDENGAEYDSQ